MYAYGFHQQGERWLFSVTTDYALLGVYHLPIRVHCELSGFPPLRATRVYNALNKNGPRLSRSSRARSCSRKQGRQISTTRSLRAGSHEDDCETGIIQIITNHCELEECTLLFPNNTSEIKIDLVFDFIQCEQTRSVYHRLLSNSVSWMWNVLILIVRFIYLYPWFWPQRDCCICVSVCLR